MIILGIRLSVLLIDFLFIQVYPSREQKNMMNMEFGPLFVQEYNSMFRIIFAGNKWKLGLKIISATFSCNLATRIRCLLQRIEPFVLLDNTRCAFLLIDLIFYDRT